MDMLTARALVHADQRESYPDMTEAEAVAHAVNTLTLPDAPPTVGAMPVDDDGSDTAEAYLTVLREPDAPGRTSLVIVDVPAVLILRVRVGEDYPARIVDARVSALANDPGWFATDPSREPYTVREVETFPGAHDTEEAHAAQAALDHIAGENWPAARVVADDI